eukprot:GHVS01035019.1.p2 GENE.GHVS01035019.1~~GHVS01035019.1.p2  ORF type:complete len:127 (-),score=8.10 GHVS01035019.1:224-604(-)
MSTNKRTYVNKQAHICKQTSAHKSTNKRTYVNKQAHICQQTSAHKSTNKRTYVNKQAHISVLLLSFILSINLLKQCLDFLHNTFIIIFKATQPMSSCTYSDDVNVSPGVPLCIHKSSFCAGVVRLS